MYSYNFIFIKIHSFAFASQMSSLRRPPPSKGKDDFGQIIVPGHVTKLDQHIHAA